MYDEIKDSLSKLRKIAREEHVLYDAIIKKILQVAEYRIRTS